MPPLEGASLDEETLLEAAAGIIQARVDEGTLGNRDKLTFEYRSGAYIAVTAPRW